MSLSTSIILILVLLVPLWFRLARDFVSGLAYGVVILIASTHFLQIPTPGVLPELTIHRLVFLSILAAWFLNPHRIPIGQAPLAKPILVWGAFALISLLGAVDFTAGLKRFLEFAFELFWFYLILATTLRREEDGLRLLRAAVIGLFVVATLAVFEKYTGINVVDRFVGIDPEARVRDVRSTYRHRILLGTGMAMGWPLAIALFRIYPGTARRLFPLLAAAAMLAACYFARSRGPWLGAMLAGALVIWLGTNTLRKPLIGIGFLALFVLILRPGVWETIFGLASQTVDTDSFKGGTFRYRLELWLVAFDGIKDSPWRLLFGNGPAAGLNQSIGWALSYRDNDQNIWSWDNDFAYALFQYGFLGLIATFAVYGTVAYRLLTTARRLNGIHRDIYACLCASAMVLFFMMSNVTVFARQIHYLFWTITAIALVALPAAFAVDAETDNSDTTAHDRDGLDTRSPSRRPHETQVEPWT